MNGHPVPLDQWIADTAQTADHEQRELLALFQKEWSEGARVNPLLFPLIQDPETWGRHFEWFLTIEHYQVPIREWGAPDAVSRSSAEDETVVIGSRLSDPDQETVLMSQMPDSDTVAPSGPPTDEQRESIPPPTAGEDKTVVYTKEETPRESGDMTTVIMDYKEGMNARKQLYDEPGASLPTPLPDTLLMEEGLLTVHDRPTPIKPVSPPPTPPIEPGPAKPLAETGRTETAPDSIPAAKTDDKTRPEKAQTATSPGQVVHPSHAPGPQGQAKAGAMASTSIGADQLSAQHTPSAETPPEIKKTGSGPPRKKVKKKKKASPDHPSKKLSKSKHADNQGLELELDDLEDMSWLDD